MALAPWLNNGGLRVALNGISNHAKVVGPKRRRPYAMPVAGILIKHRPCTHRHPHFTTEGVEGTDPELFFKRDRARRSWAEVRPVGPRSWSKMLNNLQFLTFSCRVDNFGLNGERLQRRSNIFAHSLNSKKWSCNGEGESWTPNLLSGYASAYTQTKTLENYVLDPLQPLRLHERFDCWEQKKTDGTIKAY